MRLRTRMQAELQTRLSATLPEVLATVWDHQSVIVVVEQLKFTSCGGNDKDGWAQTTKFSGVLRAELRADDIDTLEVEPLIADLMAKPLHLLRDDAAPVDSLSETARAILVDWRDVVRDTQVVAALRFNVDGTILRRVPMAKVPELLISEAPEIGPGNEHHYQRVEDLA